MDKRTQNEFENGAIMEAYAHEMENVPPEIVSILLT